MPFCPECFAKRSTPCLEHGRVRAPHRVRQLVADGLVVVKRSRRWRTLFGLLLFALVACGDNEAPSSPDAMEVPDVFVTPTCGSILEACGVPANQTKVCVFTGECYCDPDGRGPEEPIACVLEEE